MLQLALSVIAVVVVCAIVGGLLGSLIFRFATRDHPTRITAEDVTRRINDHYYKCEKCGAITEVRQSLTSLDDVMKELGITQADLDAIPDDDLT